MITLAKTYQPSEFEQPLYDFWERSGFFQGNPDPSREPFCIVIPPPNVTGQLHLGHALDNTIQDILVRRARMQGRATLWIPGTDHAGIATQNVVERELAKEGKTRHDLGREAFIERVWEWKGIYEARIISQLKRLGVSCDWSRLRFTMDEGLSQAVRVVFVRLFEEGLIYRGNRIINWCPRCETALADIEVEYSEVEGELTTFRYMLEEVAETGSGPRSQSGFHIDVSTTRLETMLGDTAVAVHPKDARYSNIVGRRAVHPFSERKLPVVADEAVDRAFGTGAVKVTPAHDPTDYEIGRRANLEALNIFDGKARITAEIDGFRGLDRYEARSRVGQALAELGLIQNVQRPYIHAVGHCYRCHTEVEPWLSEQWFVSTQPLAAPAIAAVQDGRTRIVPARWEKPYFNWMAGIRDWCISRQIWWGHRIPVWYCDECDQATAAVQDPSACPNCGSANLRQDPDVLDTWFSSGLWPFSTLGWPQDTEELKYFYPTSVLVTGYEILYLWVARMMMLGLHFKGDVAFRDVLIHGLVRDPEGKKMSKSTGNVIDPLDLIELYGTDALRYALSAASSGAQDIPLRQEWVQGARNFANKLWNAARFVLTNASDMQLSGAQEQLPAEGDLEDRWILSRLERTRAQVEVHLDEFELGQAARAMHSFVWSEFCDWYIELAKVRLYGDKPERAKAAGSVALFVLDQVLHLLHPIMPFITDALWRSFPGRQQDASLVIDRWPDPHPSHADLQAEDDFAGVQSVVSVLRSFRAEHKVPSGVRLQAVAVSPLQRDRAVLEAYAPNIQTLARLSSFEIGGSAPALQDTARLVAQTAQLFIPLQGILDIDDEVFRLGKAIEELSRQRLAVQGRLENPLFRANAPEDVVSSHEQRLTELRDREHKLAEQLGHLRN